MTDCRSRARARSSSRSSASKPKTKRGAPTTPTEPREYAFRAVVSITVRRAPENEHYSVRSYDVDGVAPEPLTLAEAIAYAEQYIVDSVRMPPSLMARCRSIETVGGWCWAPPDDEDPT